MIDYARMLKGQVPLISNGFSVPELVSDLVDMMAPNAEIQGVEILVIPDPSTPHKLMGDSTRLLEILCILMDNAIRYSPSSGTVWFRIWHSDMAMGSCMMHFEIQDEGPGMDESALSGAILPFQRGMHFEIQDEGPGMDESALSGAILPFQRGPGTGISATGTGTSTGINNSLISAHGMGLGLPMAEYWTERMGGRLTITSDGSGRGTTVTVVIPMDTHRARSESLELPSRQMYRITGCCSEAVPLQLQWLGCEEWDGQPLCADAPPILTVQDTTRCSQPQYDATIRTTFLDVGLRPQGSRPDDVESWSYLPKPVKPSSLLAVLRETAPAPEPWATTAPAMRLLVVDDNAVNRRLVKIHFEDWAIDEAENGQQGVRMAQSAVVPYHAILMDINMPVMDGYDATRAIRRLAPYKRTPILGISANAMSTDERWMECGMTAMHPKPVKWGALRE
eukprot:CAMPEP_0174379456 /NCGR_PEP_ID=MMETSP0811_2-20130205/122727_1 /TAXON_ID=73025 ORGANISM="Eutreptiella gymnastica-like, Strain CCMP1594" /NCGR_SAMPLE_ID=MMETSP0811_2 /ASSEMBLY_ACC=CAM_ASM_000667 /LENGTH=450 /DNA_ID=CAMNT_0015532007 /DNA_START=1 /DNA_END=1350 /DNA_ORIENTATION=-